MLYLLAAILSSALVSVTLRLATEHTQNEPAVFMANYGICALLSVLFGLSRGIGSAGAGAGLSVPLGLLSGVMYLGSFALLRSCIRQNGVVLSATFMKLGVLIPTILAFTAFGERIRLHTAIGIVISLGAILLTTDRTSPTEDIRHGAVLLLPILLIAGGLTDALAGIYERYGDPAGKDLYLLITFGTAGLLCGGAILVRRSRVRASEFLWGALLGIPNYFSSRFLLGALSRLPASTVYPAYNVGGILLVGIFGLLLFRESLSRRKWIGMGLILAALVLLSA